MNKTFTSEDARNKMRDLLDAVVAGQEVIIERHSKPVGVIIPHGRWLAWKQQRKSEFDQIRADMDAGNYFTHDWVHFGKVLQRYKCAYATALFF